MPFALLYIAKGDLVADYMRDLPSIEGAYAAALQMACDGGSPLAIYEQANSRLWIVAGQPDIKRMILIGDRPRAWKDA